MKRFCLLAITLMALPLFGCSSPILGKWRSDNKLPNGRRNTMGIDSDNTGWANVYATPAGDWNAWVKFKFDVDWEDQGEKFELNLSCNSGPCNGNENDFSMKCQVIDEGNDSLIRLNCNANHAWASYPFDWEEVLE